MQQRLNISIQNILTLKIYQIFIIYEVFNIATLRFQKHTKFYLVCFKYDFYRVYELSFSGMYGVNILSFKLSES